MHDLGKVLTAFSFCCVMIAALGVEIVSAFYKLYPRDFQVNQTLGLIGARWVLQAIKDGQDPRVIVRNWQAALDEFGMLRAKYLFYPADGSSH